MTREPADDELELERYLDGTLDAAARRRFEERLAGDPGLDALAGFERELTDRLRGHAAPAASVDDLLPPAVSDEASVATATPPPRRRAAGWVLVATLFVLAGVIWSRNWPVVPEPYRFAPRPLTTLYAEVVDAGFRPGWVCTTNARFAGTFAERVGRPLLLESLPPDRAMVGLSYLGGLSDKTTALLARVDGEPVVVFVDRVANAKAEEPSPEADELRIHRRLFADLVLIEVGPFDDAVVAPLLFEPEADFYDAEGFPGS